MNPVQQWRLAVDVERCTGCHACSVACKAEYRVPLGRFRSKVYYRDAGQFPAVKRHFLPAFCMQCKDAPCSKACPAKAISHGADGIVRVDPARCASQRKNCGTPCEPACPYGAIATGPQGGTADKCDFCSDRLAARLQPTCVAACPTEALVFGDTKLPDSPISRFMASARGKEASPIERGGQPQVVYRGADLLAIMQLPNGRPHDPQSYEIERWAVEGQR